MDRRFFISGNTADGFVSFYDDIIEAYGLKKLYILKGGSGVGKSTFIKRFAESFKQHNVDYFYCSGDPKSLDGAVITDLCIGIIDGTAPHMVDPKYPGVIDEIVNLGEFIDSKKLEKNLKPKIDELNRIKKEHYKEAYKNLSEARNTHMELETLYKGCVDFDKVNAKLEQILKRHTI